jgi:dTDP-glucose 4,6-dehydratase
LGLGKKIPLHNSGTPIRNWLHAQDTADAIITIIESRIINEIYNIAGGFEQPNIITVKKVITEYLGDVDFFKYIDTNISRKGQDVRYALDDSKLKKLGWKPQKQFDQELTDIIKYYKDKFIW